MEERKNKYLSDISLEENWHSASIWLCTRIPHTTVVLVWGLHKYQPGQTVFVCVCVWSCKWRAGGDANVSVFPESGEEEQEQEEEEEVRVNKRANYGYLYYVCLTKRTERLNGAGAACGDVSICACALTSLPCQSEPTQLGELNPSNWVGGQPGLLLHFPLWGVWTLWTGVSFWSAPNHSQCMQVDGTVTLSLFHAKLW